MADEAPKIIVDSDWKARVAREREDARRKAEDEARLKAEAERLKAEALAAAKVPAAPVAEPHPLAGAPPAPAAAAPSSAPRPEAAAIPEAGESGAASGEEGPIEANFTSLVGSLATQAMFALGVLAAPGQREVYVNLDQAAFAMETLDMLREKTKGNLTPEESAHLDQALLELERIFQARVLQFQQQSMRGLDPNALRQP